METSPLICGAIQCTSFYMIGSSGIKRVKYCRVEFREKALPKSRCILNVYRLFQELHSKSMDWFLYDNDLRHERVKQSPVINACPKIDIDKIIFFFHISLVSLAPPTFFFVRRKWVLFKATSLTTLTASHLLSELYGRINMSKCQN